jgi:hypothetical protein
MKRPRKDIEGKPSGFQGRFEFVFVVDVAGEIGGFGGRRRLIGRLGVVRISCGLGRGLLPLSAEVCVAGDRLGGLAIQGKFKQQQGEGGQARPHCEKCRQLHSPCRHATKAGGAQQRKGSGFFLSPLVFLPFAFPFSWWCWRCCWCRRRGGGGSAAHPQCCCCCRSNSRWGCCRWGCWRCGAGSACLPRCCA